MFFLFLEAVVNIPIQTLIILPLISQDDHLTAGAWITCAQTKIPDSSCLTSLRIKCSYYLRLRVRVRLSSSLRSAASSRYRGSC